MQLIDWFTYCVRNKYADFAGRASRAEYWWYQLAYLFLFAIILLIDLILKSYFLEIILCLGLLLPTVSVLVRRLHDTDKSGWWILVQLIPIAGFIVILVFTLADGDQHNNRYGKPPAQIY